MNQNHGINEDARRTYDPADPETMAPADQARVLAYQKKYKLWDMSFDQVAQRALPRKYGKQGSMRKQVRTRPPDKSGLDDYREGTYDPADPETMPREDQQRVLAYQREHNLFDLSFDEVAQRAFPKRYGKKGTMRKQVRQRDN